MGLDSGPRASERRAEPLQSVEEWERSWMWRASSLASGCKFLPAGNSLALPLGKARCPLLPGLSPPVETGEAAGPPWRPAGAGSNSAGSMGGPQHQKTRHRSAHVRYTAERRSSAGEGGSAAHPPPHNPLPDTGSSGGRALKADAWLGLARGAVTPNPQDTDVSITSLQIDLIGVLNEHERQVPTCGGQIM